MEIFIQNKSLILIALLIVTGLSAYFLRRKRRKTETPRQAVINDWLILLAVQIVFAFFTYTLMPSAYFSPESREITELKSLADAETQLKNQYEDIQTIRQNLDDTIELTRTFVMVSGFLLPLFIFNLSRRHFAKDLEDNPKSI